MENASKVLIDYISKEGAIEGSIITVESFLNHKIKPELIKILCEDIIENFKNVFFNKILTVESSGIVFASYISFLTGKEFIFVKKKRPITMKEYFKEVSYSFTKKTETDLYLSKNVISKKDKFLFVDDFCANGNTYNSVSRLVRQAESEIVCSAVIINKSDNRKIYSILNKEDLNI
jgi:xanthine phosphoribosyltransferase